MIRQVSKVAVVGAALLGVASLGGCATKKYVGEQLAPVSAKVAEHGQRLDSIDKTAHEAMERADAAHKLAEGKFVYSQVLSDDSIKFASGKSDLSPEATARLDAFVDRLKSENRNVYIEVQGHTDAREKNDKLGAQRAEAVRRYLNRQGVPLNRIGVISYGHDAPVEPDNTADGRAANRRVVLIVMA